MYAADIDSRGRIEDRAIHAAPRAVQRVNKIVADQVLVPVQ